jgi:hypothetical protein
VLIYLNQRTWSSGATSDAFADEVRYAMQHKVQLLLAHEMVGVDDDGVRGSCEFREFFDHDATPQVRRCMALLLHTGLEC